MAANLHTKPTDLERESAGCLLPFTSTIAVHYHYSARKIVHLTDDGKLRRPIAVRMYSTCPRLYITVDVMTNNCRWWNPILACLTLQSGMLPLDHWDLFLGFSDLLVHAPTTSHSANLLLSPSTAPSLFHSRLKTYLFHKSFPP